MTWVQVGNFETNIMYRPDSGIKNEVRYVNHDSGIQSIRILGYHQDSEERCIVVTFDCKESQDMFINLLPASLDGLVISSIKKMNAYITPSNRMNDMFKFIQAVYKFNNPDRGTRIKIGKCLGFSNELIDKLEENLNNSEVNQSLQNILAILNSVKCQNDLLIEKVNSLEIQVALLKNKNAELTLPESDETLLHGTKNGFFN